MGTAGWRMVRRAILIRNSRKNRGASTPSIVKISHVLHVHEAMTLPHSYT